LINTDELPTTSQRDYDINLPVAGHDTLLSGTSTQTIDSVLGGSENISKDVAEIG
jgi:hypothetical protein